MNNIEPEYERLLKWREEVFSVLKGKYGNEPYIGILENIEYRIEQLRFDKARAKPFPGIEIPSARPVKVRPATSDEIASLAADHLRNRKGPTEVLDILNELRQSLQMPKDEKKAKISVSAVLSRRKEMFRKIPARDGVGTQWELVEND